MANGKPGRPKGKSTKSRSTRAKKNTLPDKIRLSDIDVVDKIYTCQCCGKNFTDQKKNFSHGQSQLYAGNNYCLPVCKNCLDKLFDHYYEALGGDLDETCRRMCMKFDIYFSPHIVDMVRNLSADRSKMLTYIARTNLVAYQGKTFDTTLDEEKNKTIDSQEEMIRHNDGIESGNKQDVSYIVTKEDIVNWGYGFEPDDYVWLNEAYDELKATNVIDTTIRNELVRDYCKHKLLANKAMKDGHSDMYIKFSEAAQKTLDKASLTPKIEDAADKAGEKPIGVMIKMFEKERPIPEPRPEWKDVDGIIKFITVYFIGHLCSMLNLKNKYAVMYEEEMDRYRAVLPEYENSSDDEIFDAIIDGGIKAFDNTPEGRGDIDGI